MKTFHLLVRETVYSHVTVEAESLIEATETAESGDYELMESYDVQVSECLGLYMDD